MTLIAQFDSVAVDKMLQRLGLAAPEEAAALAETPSTATLWIGGIRNADDYARVMAYLAEQFRARRAAARRRMTTACRSSCRWRPIWRTFVEAVEIERTLAAAAVAGRRGADATLTLVP